MRWAARWAALLPHQGHPRAGRQQQISSSRRPSPDTSKPLHTVCISNARFQTAFMSFVESKFLEQTGLEELF